VKLKLKIPLFFAAALALSLLAGLAGLLVVGHSLDTFESEVMQRVADERAIDAVSSHFKTQVQEWKDTLLRGSDSALLQKHWTAFQAQERQVVKGADALRGKLGDAALDARLDRFIAAQRKMAAGYREGFDKFNATGFDSRSATWPCAASTASPRSCWTISPPPSPPGGRRSRTPPSGPAARRCGSRWR